MKKMFFLNLPVDDLSRSIAFYEAVGAVKDARFTDAGGAMLSFSDAIHVMLLTQERIRDFTDRPIISPADGVQGLFTLSEDSRDAVDATIARATSAGGVEDPSPIEDYGFMYGRSFADPDGHLWGVTWLDIEAALASGQADAAA